MAVQHLFIQRYEKKWRLKFRFNQKIICDRHFGDVSYGGKEESLKAALAKRELIASCVGVKIGSSKKEKPRKASKRNKTGVVGVSLTRAVPGKPRYYRSSICVSPGKEVVKSFNIDVLGEEEAFKQACIHRKAGEEKKSKI